jgi:UDP-N-acetylglucosamine--N-acetylmuramyl-(pentapeptide) pyrophosphoryl-undecaprenol N-acetylglucosamine transferase
MFDKPLHIMFTGGGTGGHLFPGLAVARELARRSPESRVTFCGTGKDWERKQVADAGFDYRTLPAAPFVASPMGLLRALYSNGIGYRAARRLIVTDSPTVVVGLGGYSSVPLAVAASRHGVPLVLLEQNVIPGRANRWLARWAVAVCISFEDSADHLSVRPRIAVTGNPVRADIIDASTARAESAIQSRDADPLLLVLGGSQGAHSINRFVTESLPKLTDFLADWQIVHQTGAKDVEWVRAAYETHKVRADVVPFINDMADVYRRATLAVARAGATTLAELAVAGVPALLLPYPFATANHQWHNAQAFGRAGAAIVVDDRPEPGRTTSALVSAIAPLLRLPELRREMRLAMLKLARPDAVDAVVTEILSAIGVTQAARQSA